MTLTGIHVSDYESGVETMIKYPGIGIMCHHANLEQPLRKHAQLEHT